MKHSTMATILRELLESSFPETAKVPGREGGYIRVPVSVNTEWYRRFCANHERWRGRKTRTIIKRCHTIAALKRMEAGNFNGVYAERLKPFLCDDWIPPAPRIEKRRAPEEVEF
jgi:hypothetical protein